MAYPNGLYSAFSFIGFLFCLIPLYWHLEGIFVPRLCPSLDSRASSLECRHRLVNGLGWPGLFEWIHQFGRLGPQHSKCGPGLV